MNFLWSWYNYKWHSTNEILKDEALYTGYNQEVGKGKVEIEVGGQLEGGRGKTRRCGRRRW